MSRFDELSPHEQYEQLMRERYGDPAALRRELDRPVPPPPTHVADRKALDASLAAARAREPRTAPRPPSEPGTYAAEHTEVERWLRTKHPEWEPNLVVFDGGYAAHVVVRRHGVKAATLCGKRGETTPASDAFPPCRPCIA